MESLRFVFPARSGSTLPQGRVHRFRTTRPALGRLCAAVVVALAGGCTAVSSTPTTAVPDAVFVRGAATSGANEIQAGRVAQDKASDPSVRAYAARMVQDHTQASTQLKGILATKGVAVAEAPDAEHVAILANLSAMSGPSFDRAYLQQMVVDHRKTVALFDTETRTGTDSDVRSFATTTLPILQQHLQMTQQMSQQMASGTPTSR